MPGAVSSLLLIIIGAIAKYAYSDTTWSWTASGHDHSLQVDTVGMILIVAGIIALFLSILWAFLHRTPIIEEPAFEEEEEKVEVKKANKPAVKARKTTRRKTS